MTNSSNPSLVLNQMATTTSNSLANLTNQNTGENYFDNLQELYNDGKDNPDKTICEDSAEGIINNFGIDFGTYKDNLTDAIEGMTRIEAYMYLNEVLSHVDKADGQQDQTINPEIDLTSAFIFAGIGQSENEIENKLETSAAEFKENDDPLDTANIAFLQSTQNTTPPQFNPNLALSPFSSFSLPLEQAYKQMGDFTDALGVTNPKLGNTLDTTGTMISDVNDLLSTMLPMLNILPLLMRSLATQGNNFTNRQYIPPATPFDMFSATNNFNTSSPNVNNYMGYLSY